MKSRIPRTATEKVTLKEIARAAKVSIATASRVLNGSGGGSPDVVRRVRATAARLQAKLERPAASRTICFLLANRSMLHSFHAQVLMGCQEFAKEQQNHVLFYPFHYPATADPADIDLPLLDGRSAVDGYVVSGMNTENLLQLLIQDGVPFSVLGNNVLGPWEPDAHDVVWMDDLTGAYELTGYLLRKGHEKIGFLGSSRFPSSRIQLGYSRAMQEAGLSPLSVENDVAEEAECGYLAAKSIFATGSRVTALFGYNDGVARGAIEAARAHGLRVPEDVSVVGFGNRPEAEALSPALTSVWGYPAQVGRRLAELVMERIGNPDTPRRQIVLPTRLIERNSVASPRG